MTRDNGGPPLPSGTKKSAVTTGGTHRVRDASDNTARQPASLASLHQVQSQAKDASGAVTAHYHGDGGSRDPTAPNSGPSSKDPMQSPAKEPSREVTACDHGDGGSSNPPALESGPTFKRFVQSQVKSAPGAISAPGHRQYQIVDLDESVSSMETRIAEASDASSKTINLSSTKRSIQQGPSQSKVKGAPEAVSGRNLTVQKSGPSFKDQVQNTAAIIARQQAAKEAFLGLASKTK